MKPSIALWIAVFSMLVLQFIPQADVAVREMRRVTRRSGTVAAAIWDTCGGLVTHRRIFEGAMHHMHQGENKRREEHCVVHQTAKKSSPWTQRFAYEDIKRVLERAMISSAVLA